MRKDHPNVKLQLNYGGLTAADGCWNGKIRTVEANLDLPLRTRKATVWAVWNDLFHEDVRFPFIDDFFDVCERAPQHTYLLLTKRIDQAYNFFDSTSNRVDALQRSKVWLGVTCENQQAADERIPILLQIPATVRWVSVEPMLEPMSLGHIQFDRHTNMNVLEGCGVSQRSPAQSIPNAFCEKLDWVVCGCESGPAARPMEMRWAQYLKDECQMSGTPFFLKQANIGGKLVKMPELDGRTWAEFPKMR